jgi:TPR repeat protein
MRWYERAAKGSNAEAAARLCKMHLAGQGTARDEAAARRWYERAAELGYDWANE